MADIVIGNPPFLGGKLLITHLGEAYVARMFKTYAGRVPVEVDLVCYWFEKAGRQIASGKASRAGLVATNSIRGGANRRALEAATETRRIFEAWSDEPWVIDGAAVRVPLVCFSRADDDLVSGARLDGEPVDEIYTDLTARRGGAGVDLTRVRRLPENAGVAVMGDTKGGSFDVSGDLARAWLRLPANPNGLPNTDVPKPWVNGMDLTWRPAGKRIVDFGWTMPEGDAAQYERGVPMGEGAGLPNAPAEPARSLSRVLVAPRRAAPRDVAGSRRPDALHRDADRRQASVVRLVRHARRPGPPADRRRAGRRCDLRHPAQPVPRALVAPALHVAREGYCRPGWEHSQVTVERDGRISTTTGASPQGRARPTSCRKAVPGLARSRCYVRNVESWRECARRGGSRRRLLHITDRSTLVDDDEQFRPWRRRPGGRPAGLRCAP